MSLDYEVIVIVILIIILISIQFTLNKIYRVLKEIKDSISIKKYKD